MPIHTRDEKNWRISVAGVAGRQHVYNVVEECTLGRWACQPGAMERSALIRGMPRVPWSGAARRPDMRAMTYEAMSVVCAAVMPDSN